MLDSIDDDDDIEWPENPFDYREDQNTETTEELLAMIRFEGSVGFQAKLRKLCEEYIDVFSTRVRHQSAKVEPMSIVVDRGKWEVSRNRLPPRHHNSDKLVRWSCSIFRRYTGKMIIGKLSEFVGILTANCCTAILRPFQRCLGATNLMILLLFR